MVLFLKSILKPDSIKVNIYAVLLKNNHTYIKNNCKTSLSKFVALCIPITCNENNHTKQTNYSLKFFKKGNKPN